MFTTHWGEHMEQFEGLDFYDIESLLTEEEIMIRDMVREWVDEEVLPKIEHACEAGVFPDEWRVALGEMGVSYTHLTLPTTYEV